MAAVALVSTVLAGAIPGPLYAPDGLARIVDPKPRLVGWSFERSDLYIYPVPAHDPAFTLREWLLANSPSQEDKALAAKLAKAGFLIGRHLVWDGTHGRRHAHALVFAHLSRTAARAQTASRLLHLPGGTRNSQLGSDAWELSDGKTGASLTWRRGNLFLYGAIDCDDTDCRFPPLPPARAYAAQIDGRAKHFT